MIVARAPLRVSLGGGGTDLPAYYERFGGFVLSAAIQRYTYATVNARALGDVRFVHDEIECVAHVRELRHPIAREALKSFGVERGIDVTSVSDLPGGTGLGSSGSFSVALLRALHEFHDRDVTACELAEEACELEMRRLGEPSGKQDPYIAAFGGVTALTIERDGTVRAERLEGLADAMAQLERRLVLAYSGMRRASRTVLAEQAEHVRLGTKPTVEGMHRIKEIGFEALRTLRAGDLDSFGALLHEHWLYKRGLTSNVSAPRLDAAYEAARGAGALGGKLLGAGAGGFFLFYTPESARSRVCESLVEHGLEPLAFRVAPEGVQLVARTDLPRE